MKRPLPRNILKPMLATLIDSPFTNDKWMFEIKYDGYRLIAYVREGAARLYSRNTIDVTNRYAEIARALSRLPEDVILDGELVALDRTGVSRFELMQKALESGAPLYYYVFDLLYLDGKDLRSKPLIERKKMLKSILPSGGFIRYSDHIKRQGERFFKLASKRKLEGVIGKLADSTYSSGKRSRDWVKIKCSLEQEAIIVGFTKPRASRKYFGSLVLAVHEGGKLAYVGHSGGGFDDAELKTLHAALMKMRAPKPLAGKIPRESDITWVKPKLVCEVRFTEWTSSGQMRHPVFLGLRSDKRASQVIRETPIRGI